MTESLLAAVAQAAAPAVAPPTATPSAPASSAPAPAPTAEAIAAARAEGETSGRTAERARCKAILQSDEAQGREAQAAHIAFDTDMSAESGVAMLKNSAKAQPSGTSQLDAVMTDPKVGAGAPQQTQEQAVEGGLAAAVDRLIKR